MQYLDKNKNGQISIQLFPFASKYTKTGKLYREKFGQSFNLNDANTNGGITTVDINNPFDISLVNKAEFKWFPEGVTCQMIILDSPTGIYQASLGVPEGSRVANAPLTTHGHDVGIAANNDEDVSEYDAKLLKDMKLRFIFTNTTNVSKTCCVNVVFHKEVVS